MHASRTHRFPKGQAGINGCNAKPKPGNKRQQDKLHRHQLRVEGKQQKECSFGNPACVSKLTKGNVWSSEFIKPCGSQAT